MNGKQLENTNTPIVFMSNVRQQIFAIALLSLGLVIRVYLGMAYPNIYWADEIYQTLEQAHRLIFEFGIEPWEYKDGLRHWLFPGLLAGVMWLTEPLAEGSYGYLFGTKTFMCLLSLTPAVVAYLWAQKNNLGQWSLVALFVPLVWMELIYMAPKAFYETFTAYLLLGGLFFIQFARKTWWRPALGGLLIGLACISRLQLTPALVATCLALPFVTDRPHYRFSAVVTGFAVGFGLGGILDAMTWGAPFQSIVVNYHTNLIEGKAAEWGTTPFYGYIEWMFQVSPTGTILLLLGTVAGLYRYPILSWPAVAILLAHSAIGHKEYRFIYPYLTAATILVGLEMATLLKYLQVRLPRQRNSWAAMAGIAFCLLLMGSSMANGINFHTDNLGKYQEGKYLLWNRQGGGLRALRELSLREDLCGVGILNKPWWGTGGYTYLHRDVGFRYLKSNTDIVGRKKEMNVVVVYDWKPGRITNLGPFEKTKCYLDTCVLERPGKCELGKENG